MSKKITIFQMEDIENSPKRIDISGLTMTIIYIPRQNIKDLLDKEDDFNRPGVYILKFDPDNDDYSEKIYIGEGEPLKTRINQHLKNPEMDFKECVIITSTRENELTKSHIKNMESKLYDIAVEAKNSEIYNSNKPTKSSLSKADEDLVDDFIKQIKIILPLCGFNCFVATTTQVINNSEIYNIKINNITAEMIIEDNKYIVKKGSLANIKTAPKYSQIYKETRKKLLNNNDIVQENDVYVFKENIIFSSSSHAASVVLGYNVSGLETWINKNNNKKLKDC